MNDGERGQAGRRGPRPAGTRFRSSMLAVAVPIWGLGALSVGGYVAEGLYYLWYIAALYALIALFVGIGFAVSKNSRDLGNGTLAGVGIGVLGLGVTCFANLATVQFP